METKLNFEETYTCHDCQQELRIPPISPCAACGVVPAIGLSTMCHGMIGPDGPLEDGSTTFDVHITHRCGIQDRATSIMVGNLKAAITCKPSVVALWNRRQRELTDALDQWLMDNKERIVDGGEYSVG